LSQLFRSKAVDGWNLFWLISGPISIAMLIAMTGADLSSGEGVSRMIQISVRCAVPLLYLTFAASSIRVLFTGEFSRWILRNRKILGLCFAVAMAWQLLFILWLTTVFSDYYVNEVYVLRDAIEGVLGYLALIAMVVTSFKPGRRLLRPQNWKLLHKSGIYFLWAYAFSVYWWNLFYYGDPIWLDYVYYWSGLLACGIRIAAWRKKHDPPNTNAVLLALGLVLVSLGLTAAATDALWRTPFEALFTGHAITQPPELYLPYYPPTPFVSLFIIALGAFLTTRSRRGSSPSRSST
jgi:hypothetical protein